MSTLRISNIEAKSVPASATIDEKVKITNSSGDPLVFIDGKTSGITTVGINTTDGNITFDANSNVVVTGIITATKFVGTIEPTNLTVGGDLTIPDKIIHTGDTNTSLRFPAADTFAVETAGSERLRIDSNGQITHTNFSGVGFIMSGAGDPTFQISDTDGTNQFVQLAHNGGDSYIVTRNNTSHGEFLLYSQNGSETLNRFKLHSNGDISCGGAADNNIYNDSSGGGINFKNGGQLVIAKQASSGADPLVWLNDTGQTTNKFLLFAQDGTEKASIGLAGNDLRFARDGYNETLRIDSSGRLITGAVATADTGTYYDDITINNSNTASGAAGGAGLSLVCGATSYGGVIFSKNSSHGRGYMKYDMTNDRLILGTQTIDRLMIEDAGNNGDVHIKTGNIVFDTSGRGIDFSATSDASGSTSELFADYERGVHTFTVGGTSGNPTVNIASAYNKLYYTKIGDMVHVTGELRWTISSHGSGDLTVSIPFTSDSTANSNSQGTAQAWNVNWTYRSGQEQLFSEVAPNHNYMRFRIGGSNTLYEDYLDCGSSYQKTANSGYGVEYQVSIWYRTG